MGAMPSVEPRAAAGPIDSVLLIDGDNDPHFPPDFEITDRTLVRVFVRLGAKMPRGLEKRLGTLPMCVTVISPKTGSNAADFVMALHAGVLHATLPMQLPFTIVTNDKSLAVTVQELQRVGRQASLWTSHPEKSVRKSGPARTAEKARGEVAVRGRSRRGGRGRARVTPSPAAVEVVAAAYAARLARIKDPPSRLSTLTNDIANRTGNAGYDPKIVIEELKRLGVVTIDANGRVHRRQP